MSSLIRAAIDDGFTPILAGDRGRAGLKFGVLKLKEKGAIDRTRRPSAPVFEDDSGDSEVALVILGGKCVVEAAGRKWGPIGERDTVFSGKATAVYVPPHTAYRISPVGSVEIAVCGATCPPSFDAGNARPQLVMPDQIAVNVRGAGNFRREVRDIIASNVKAHRLIVGETITPAGNWSSYPPHKHDVDDFSREVSMEEVYFFKVQPGHGFGVQVMYQAGRDPREEAYLVRDGDVVLIESGYHPVAAPPGYEVYYLWLLAATGKGGDLMASTDPADAWVQTCAR